MKKILTSLFLVFAVFITAITLVQPTYAAHTSGYDIVQDSTYSDRWYVTKNSNRQGIFTANGQEQFSLDLNLVESQMNSKINSVYITLDDNGYLSTGSALITNEYQLFLHILTIPISQDQGDYEIELNFDDLVVMLDKPGQGLSNQTKMYFTFETSAIPDGTRPAISGQENFVTSVDDPKTVGYFQSFLTAIDETDGDISSSIYVVNDNYTTNKSVLGTYEITFGVKDAANNESQLKVFVTVADVTKPVITGNSSKVQISYTQTYNITTFKSTLTVTDNYDTLTNANILIHSDGYTSNKTILGTYNIVFRATDASGNFVDFTKQVEVIDDIVPIINGPTTINKPSTSILTVNDIKSQLTATDEKEGNVTSSITVIEDNYTGNGTKVGSYTITFRAIDSKGNAATRVVTVLVQDNLPPVWYIQDGVSLKLVPPATLTRQQIVDLLVATNQLNITSTMQVNFTHDTYTGNESEPGVYMMTLAYSDASGNEGTHTLSLTVLSDSDDDPITVNPKPGVINSITNWIQENPTTSIIFAVVGLLGLVLIIRKFRK